MKSRFPLQRLYVLTTHSYICNAPAAGHSVGLDGCSEPSCVLLRWSIFSVGTPVEGICASVLPLQLFWHGRRKKACVMSSAAEQGPGVILNMWHHRETGLLVGIS